MRAQTAGRPVTAGQIPTIGELLDRQGVLAYVLLLPALVILAVFIGYPFLSSLWLSVTDQSVSTSVARFVGLDNFADELGRPIFRQTVPNTPVYTWVTGAFCLWLGIALGRLVNRA